MSSVGSADPGASLLAQSDPERSSLDHPAWSSLTGVHRALAEGTGRARRYPPDVSPFAALHPDRDAQAWSDLHALVGAGQLVAMAGQFDDVPIGWSVEFKGAGVQMVATDALRTDIAPRTDIVELGAVDAAEMVELVARTEPGPFAARTYLFGGYLGIRDEGALIAMAGERLRPSGFAEISAVCTDPAYRRKGLAAALVRAVASNIRRRGEVPFLHTAQTNVNAIRLYEALGFELRREVQFAALRSPGRLPTHA
jgi:ribosomal protein S18 acetylase RimI-like enzyme